MDRRLGIAAAVIAIAAIVVYGYRFSRGAPNTLSDADDMSAWLAS